MAWKKLDTDDLKLILAQDELDRLSTLSIDSTLTDVMQKTLDMVAAVWRGALSAKGYTLDTRDLYIPAAYQYWVLVHARWALWTRFPNASNVALDAAREKEREQALELLENPYIDVEKPDWEHDPSNPANRGDSYWAAADSIHVPWPLTFPPATDVLGGCRR